MQSGTLAEYDEAEAEEEEGRKCGKTTVFENTDVGVGGEGRGGW